MANSFRSDGGKVLVRSDPCHVRLPSSHQRRCRRRKLSQGERPLHGQPPVRCAMLSRMLPKRDGPLPYPARGP